MTEASPGPLDGLVVVTLEQAVAAPLASCRLADAGARVIKLERPEGDFARGYDTNANGQSAYFAWLNRGKESVAVDLKDAADLAFVERLLAKADVFIQNLAVGAAARLGLGSDTLRARHPTLVTCDISGYGEVGPFAEMKAYDLLVQAESGLVAISGEPGSRGRVGVSVCDIATGISAALAVNEALHERARTGVGRGVKLSLFDTIAEWMAVPLAQYEYTGAAPPQAGLAHPSITPYGGFETRDGVTLVISIQNDREWVDLVTQVLDRPDLAAHPDYATNRARMAHREDVDALVQATFGKKARAELEDVLRRARIAYGAVNEVADLAKHPQLRRWNVASPTGDVALAAHPDASREVAPDARIPELDEHGMQLRQEFS